MAVWCAICGEQIVKYFADISDTICIHDKYICDKCAEEIAIQLIKR